MTIRRGESTRGGDRLRFFEWHETVRRGEPSAEQRARFEEMLLEHDLEGARLQAMAYAMKLTKKNVAASRQMVDDACRILWERCSWDPDKVGLGAYLCGVVRSERSHAAEAGITERENEVEYLTEVATLEEGTPGRSPEDLMVAYEESVEGREKASGELAAMRAHFEATGDAVNLEWIQYSLDDVDDLEEMARRSGRRVEEFYRARDRRVRYVQRLQAKKQEKA
ncbi:MAG TPA: hypothetical protein VMI75_08935 [Polyangiaceae bacterium]|nr:hypothetical protein [Polyangiaceae bacterium]